MAKKKRQAASRGRKAPKVVAAPSEDSEGGVTIATLAPVRAYLSTGCSILDLAISDRLPGGFAAGRVNHLFGEESTCKTVLAAEVAGAAQRAGGKAFFLDSERTLDDVRAGMYGLTTRVDVFRYSTPDTVQDLFDGEINAAIQERIDGDSDLEVPWVVTVDSLSAITSREEREKEVEASGYQGLSRAKSLSVAFRKYIAPVSEANICLLFVDQVRDVLDPFSSKRYTTSGGRALRFYASTQVLLTAGRKIKNKQGKIVGVTVKFRVVKNKVAPPFREGSMRVLFDYGVDDIATCLLWLKNEEGSEKSGWFAFTGADGVEHKANGLEAAIGMVENEGLEETLQSAVAARWKESYAVPDRKPKYSDDLLP